MSGLTIDPPATPLSASSPTFVYENPVQPKAICTPSVTSAATRRTAPFTGKELFELVQAAIAVKFFEAKQEHLYEVEIFYCVLVEGARSQAGVGAKPAQHTPPTGPFAPLRAAP